MPTTKLSDMDMSKVTLENLGAQFCSDWLKDQIREMLTELIASRAKLARVDGLVKALTNIAGYAGQTNFAECCVNKSCTPLYIHDEMMAHCTFQGGVNRGFDTCAEIATKALKDFGAGQ